MKSFESLLLRPGHGRWPDVASLAGHAIDLEDLLQVVECHLGRLRLGTAQHTLSQLKLFGLKNIPDLSTIYLWIISTSKCKIAIQRLRISKSII